MNRHDRRVSDASVRKTGTVSAGLLESRLRTLAAEHHQVRNVLLALIKELGRVRVSKAVLDSLSDQDMVESRDVGDAIVFEYKQSNMVTPKGATNGAGNETSGAVCLQCGSKPGDKGKRGCAVCGRGPSHAGPKESA